MTQKKIIEYPPNTAGRLMTTKVPTAFLGSTIAKTETELKKDTTKWDTINYIYILNQKKELRGVLSIKEILQAKPNTKVDELMQKEIVSARAYTVQERVARLSIAHNLKAVPVISKNNQFLGVVPSDVILNILNSEAGEDVLRAAGISTEKNNLLSIKKSSVLTHLRRRLPWLILGIAGSLGAAVVVSSFEEALQANLLLAAFIPTIVYTSDSVGSQAQTLVIRSLATEGKIDLLLYLKKEIIVALGIASALSVIIAAAVIILWQNSTVGSVLGVSVFATIFSAVIIGVSLPWIFDRLRLDPAISSGPFATIVRDIISILIYFYTAQVLISGLA
ncbi:magnesium transporter [Patescibacteria group bacterium]|nr:magnesium transporter [Patescibacteria group bacterium]